MTMILKDIARLADVSIATVSMILNNKNQNISASTRENVLRIARESNYIPNAMARSLIIGKTKIIGLIVPEISNPFFPELARGVEDKANEAGYNVIFCNSDDDPIKEERYLEMLAEKMVDGIIFVHTANRSEGLEKYIRQDVPVILIDRDMDIDNVKGKVLVNNFHGAYMGVKHLLDKGYKKIAFITGSLKSNITFDRLQGYKKALSEHDIPIDEKYIMLGQYKSEWGIQATKQLLSEGIDFDSVFCGNDLIAIGVVKTLINNGLKIPDDVGIVGFDDIWMASMIMPELTTVKQPNYEMGYKASEMLIDIIANPETPSGKKMIFLETELIIRHST